MGLAISWHAKTLALSESRGSYDATEHPASLSYV